MSAPKTLASPNHIVCELFQSLRRLCVRIANLNPDNDAQEIRQDSAIAIILSIQCVEVFLNVYFRVVVSEPDFSHAFIKINSDLHDTKFGLERKLKDWPKLVFDKKLDFSSGASQRLKKLKNQRNKLMHFKSSHETILISEIVINGLADTTSYESLNTQSAIDALSTAEDFLCEIFTLRGIVPENLSHSLHSWTGKPPL